MKSIFLFLILASLSGTLFCQEITKPEYNDLGKIVFQRVDTMDKSKDLLFGISKEWFVNTFKSGKVVIEREYKESGTMIGKGIYQSDVTKYDIPIYYHYTVKVETKKNKVRLTIYDIYTKGSGLNGVEKPAEFWFGPLCKKCKQDIFDQHQSNIIKLSEMLRSDYFKSMKKGVDLDW